MPIAQQPWVANLSVMMQSVLFAAVRAPDGIRKDHPIKVIMRWYRRSVLMTAFEGEAFNDPFRLGGGSFTGPFTYFHAYDMGLSPWPDFAAHKIWWENLSLDKKVEVFYNVQDIYLRHVDELPHHFQLHLMHAAQIVGHYHPDNVASQFWSDFYLKIVNDAHLYPEPLEALERRLGDNEDQWREREEVTAK